MFSLICTWTNGWVNNREAGDLRCQCTHYDITVMLTDNQEATWSSLLHRTPTCDAASDNKIIIILTLSFQCSICSTFSDTLRPSQNGQHSSDNIFKFSFYFIRIVVFKFSISLKFVPKGLVNNYSAFFPCRPNRWQAIIWTNVGLVQRGIYALLGLSGFIALQAHVFGMYFV